MPRRPSVYIQPHQVSLCDSLKVREMTYTREESTHDEHWEIDGSGSEACAKEAPQATGQEPSAAPERVAKVGATVHAPRDEL